MLKSTEHEELWDQLFAPLVAAAAGSLTVILLEQPVFAIDMAPYPGPQLLDLATGSLIALAAAGLGLTGIYAFPHLHRGFHRITNPLSRLTASGLVLGGLGALGGTITLFRGVEQLDELVRTGEERTVAGFTLIVVVKLVATLVAAASGYPGGKIFPAVFAGGAFGLLAHALVPGVPQALCVTAGVLGLVLAVSRDGWISLFIAVALVGDISLLPVLLVATLPTWLLLSGRPEMVLPPSPEHGAAAAG